MAGNIFLELPSISGTSLVFPKQIELSSFSWGLSNELNVHSGSTSSTSTCHVYNFSCTKRVDVATASIINACAGGKEIPTGTLRVGAPADGNTPAVTLQYDLTNVYISSYTTSASGNATDLSESFSVHFAVLKGKYTPVTNGTPGAPGIFQWNPQTNKKE